MDSIIVLGALLVITLISSIFVKNYLEKRRIEKARELVDIHDDLRRMQNAMNIIPGIYFDIPTRIFMLKRTMLLISKVLELGQDNQNLNALYQDLEIRLEKTLEAKDDSVKRMNKHSQINDPDTAHEIRQTIKFLHDQILKSVKTGLIPKSQGSRVVKNLKVIMQRTVMDMHYNIAQHLLSNKKFGPAMSKFKVTLSLVLKSPSKQALTPFKDELERVIKKIEHRLNEGRKKASQQSANKLSSGMDKIKEEEDWESKKNIYD
ncbi:hypothetical protein NBRC116188_05050 [Oceaniserpentilla sp. 4NH20-0058]|uniref:hypothetical protein n=1 Tax=Oceaniserpentilla sp. 4NH20-0058 TaxID=3127660 RepID=UPI003101B64C